MLTQEKNDKTWQWQVEEKVRFYIVLTHLCLPCVCVVTPQEGLQYMLNCHSNGSCEHCGPRGSQSSRAHPTLFIDLIVA